MVEVKMMPRAAEFLLVAAVELLLSSSTEGEVLTIRPGKNALVFDGSLQGRSFKVFVPRKGEPWSEDQENIAHDYGTLSDVMAVEPTLNGKFTLGMAHKLGNAYAVIREGERLVVYDPALTQSWAGMRWNVTIGHEVGHHICDHTAARMAQNPWQRELEADRFSGIFLRLTENVYGGSISETIDYARTLYGVGTTSHPPGHLRLEAIQQGYDTGTACGFEAKKPQPERIGTLGIELVPTTPEWRKKYGLKSDVKGLIVTSIDDNSLGAKSKLSVGDAITLIDGDRVFSVEHFRQIVELRRASGEPTTYTSAKPEGYFAGWALFLR